MCRTNSEWADKLHSLAKLRLRRWLVGLCQCVQYGLGFLLSLCGRRKNKINSLALHLPINVALIQSIRFCKYFNFLISFQCVSVVFYTCIQRFWLGFVREEKEQSLFEHVLSRSFLFGFVFLVSQSQINKIWRLSKYT